MTEASVFGRPLRDALGQFATGVAVVTTVTEAGEPAGLTVNSFASVSLDPPLVLWSLGRYSANWEAFQEIEHFAVNILAADQEPLALAFAVPRGKPFSDLDFDKGIENLPLLPGALAQFECHLTGRQNGGDHEILIGEVLNYHALGGEPLLFHRGNFGRFRHHTRTWKR